MKRLYEDYAYSDAARADCFWQLPPHDWARAEGDLTTDVVIIGGGYTGLSAALHLAQDGVQVMVLEAEVPGWGASGRNGGFCCVGGAKASPEKLAKRFGETAAREFYHAEKGAIDLVANLLDTHAIDADTHSDGEVLLAHRPQAIAALQVDADAYTALGERAELLSRDQLVERGQSGPEFHAGMHLRLGFALNPAKFAHGLALAAEKAGVDIRARSPATKITPQNGGYVVTTPSGRITANKLILATNGYSSEDLPPWLRARFLPVQSNILVTRPLTKDEREEQGWTSDLMSYDSRHLLHYFRLLPDNRFLIGTRGNVTATATGQAAMRDITRADLTRMFPAWADVETPHFWSGLVCLARNLTPYAGPIGDWQNTWAGMAYHGNGVAMGTWTGARLADMVLGRKPPPKVHQVPLARFPLGRARRLLLRGAYHLYRWQDGD